MTYDVAIVGAGIVGLATARSLLADQPLKLVLLEAEEHVAQHQTGHNSGVLHSGLYYRPGSLKARTCAAGRKAMSRFCREQGIPHEQCGKLVVASDESEIPALRELERRGQANGLAGLQWLPTDRICEHEPHAVGAAALWVPQTGIVDYRVVAEHLAALVRQRNATIKTGHQVVAIRSDPPDHVLETTAGEVRCRLVVNCAGLQSDRVALMAGIEPGLRIIPFRGEYYALKPASYGLVRNLIYSVPDPRFPFLGAHLTRTIDGRREAGPNAVLALKRDGYRRSDVSLRDIAEMTRYRGFWQVVLRYWRTGAGEYWRSYNQRAFVRGLQRLVPGIDVAAVVRSGSGVRAQAVSPDGALVDDFRVVRTRNMVHVLNAPSPAATAALSIGDTIARMVEQELLTD